MINSKNSNKTSSSEYKTLLNTMQKSLLADKQQVIPTKKAKLKIYLKKCKVKKMAELKS